ncbi:hypothetical protein AX16_009960 [Volvariella volvacea WC 439]|nr:hypothetical protein AX16_009960 [Volvariella volvacea WC 439]
MRYEDKTTDSVNQPHDMVTLPVQPKPQHSRRRMWMYLAAFVLVASTLLWLGLSALDHYKIDIRSLVQAVNVIMREKISKDPADVSIVDCRKWTIDDPVHSAKASYDLPVDSTKLFLYSDGPLALGSVNFFSSDGGDDKVHVEVYVNVDDPEVLRYARVCNVRGAQPDMHGIGLLTEYSSSWRRHWKFNIFVRLPISYARSSITEIQELETNLPHFSHNVDNLDWGIRFKTLTLTSEDTPINITYVDGDVITARTVGGPISGSFNVSSSLKLESGAWISVSANLYNSDESNPTILRATTANSPLEGTITLASANGTGGAFKVDTRTTAGELELKIDEAPVKHILTLLGQNRYGPIRVSLPPSYEGVISEKAAWSTPLTDRQSVSDPAGLKRERQTEIRYAMHSPELTGLVFWSEEGRERGHIELATSYNPIEVTI